MSDQVKIERLSSKHLLLLRKLILLFKEVFEMNGFTAAGDAYLEHLLAMPGFVALAVLYQDKIIGGLTAFELPMYYGEYSEMYLYDIAVERGFQRRGIGKALLNALKDYCKENEVNIFFVEAEEEDNYAVAFYRSAGGKAERVIHFNFEP